MDWDAVAEELGTGRSGWAVFEAYQSQVSQLVVSGPWAEEEDARLRDVIKQLRRGDFIPWDQVPAFPLRRTDGGRR